MRNFDLRDELRATAERRRQGQDKALVDGAAVKGGVASIAERLATMFPGLPQDTVKGVVSQLFRADSGCSRQQLADKALAALLEMSLSTSPSEPQAITSFEPILSGNFEEQGEAAQTDESLDALLAELLALPDQDLRVCASTLCGILGRIHEQPHEPRFRRLRRSNPRFEAEIGIHKPALQLLSRAGFPEQMDNSEAVLIFQGDPQSEAFTAVREAMSALADSLGVPSSPARRSCSAPSAPRAKEQESQREKIAALTELRLQNPRTFCEDANRRRTAANRIVGGSLPAPAATGKAQSSRRAQHFTLSDIDRMRVQDEIASTPSYADEYRLAHQSAPARSYSTLVTRSYDPELIGRQALDGTNRYRASQGLAPLRWHDGIFAVAREHAEQMASGSAPFSHDGVEQRIRAFPFAHRGAAENLALNRGIADVSGAAVDGWIKSPGHEKNLRGPFNLCGIGVAQAANGTFYLTQLFALA